MLRTCQPIAKRCAPWSTRYRRLSTAAPDAKPATPAAPQTPSPPPPLPPTQLKPARRVLFMVPGSERKKIDKIRSCSTSKKVQAREEVSASLTKDEFGASERVVRINTLRSGLGEADLIAISKVIDQIDSILIPKVESPEEVSFVSSFLDLSCGARARHVKFLACIESARGLVDLNSICRKSPKLSALIIGAEDLCANMGMIRTPSAQELLYARSHIATHAHALGLDAIDMVCVDFKDAAKLTQESLQGAQMGFTGKQAIHPAQIQPIYDAFKPPQHILDLAKRILEENQKHQAEGKGAFSIDGKMIDAPMVKWAEHMLRKM